MSGVSVGCRVGGSGYGPEEGRGGGGGDGEGNQGKPLQ